MVAGCIPGPDPFMVVRLESLFVSSSFIWVVLNIYISSSPPTLRKGKLNRTFPWSKPGTPSLLRFVIYQVKARIPVEATLRGLGLNPTAPKSGRTWSLRQAARRLLHESLGEEENEWEEKYSQDGGVLRTEECNALLGTGGSCPSWSDWVPCSLQCDEVNQLVEEFAILLDFTISFPAPDSHPGSPPTNNMSFFFSQLRAGLRFPLPSSYCEVSRLFRVPLNQLVPNSFRILSAFSMIFQFNGVIPTATIFSQCFQLKRIESGIFHFAPRRGVSFLPIPSPPKRWKGSFFFVFPPRPWTAPNRWIDDAPPALPFSLDDRSPNLCCLLKRLNESPYDCKLMTEDKLLSHFKLSPRVEPLGGITSRGRELYGHLMLDSKREAASSGATDLLKGAATSSDRRLLSLVSREDLDKMLSQSVTLRGELLSCPAGESREGQRQKLEEQVEIAAMKEDHAEEIWTLVDQVRKDLPDTKGGRNYLYAYWVSHLSEFKKFEDYKREVALVAGPFLRFAFKACRQQFLAHGYPPAGEEVAFLNFNLVLDIAPDPFGQPISVVGPLAVDSDEDLDRILEAVEAEVRCDIDQVLGATLGEDVPKGVPPTPIVEDVPGPSKEAEVEVYRRRTLFEIRGVVQARDLVVVLSTGHALKRFGRPMFRMFIGT
ncbi:UNVERIFIED_CONTAM: hypothetical protein Sradi_2644000 [Sesamum radiatum]|uniref:Transposase (putative) gypsy type domain-containing protein n=1 Tax=Sesamum radiatum TaxID=300843 RepID=A0AAW2S6H6_SESRA